MPLFHPKRPVIEAHLWEGNGDHPLDNSNGLPEGEVVRRFNRPDFPGDTRCEDCHRFYWEHGWLETEDGGYRVCPGDLIITNTRPDLPGKYYPMHPVDFDKIFEEME